MSEEIIKTIGEVYNTLLTINVKGEDTISMAFCLQNLYNILKNK